MSIVPPPELSAQACTLWSLTEAEASGCPFILCQAPSGGSVTEERRGRGCNEPPLPGMPCDRSCITASSQQPYGVGMTTLTYRWGMRGSERSNKQLSSHSIQVGGLNPGLSYSKSHTLSSAPRNKVMDRHRITWELSKHKGTQIPPSEILK